MCRCRALIIDPILQSKKRLEILLSTQAAAMSRPEHKINQSNLHNMSTEQLKAILKQLENEHDIIEAKNQQLATHVSDIRAVIKNIQKEKDEELNYTLSKKKKLQDEIERTQAALKVANSTHNTMYTDMMAFKELSGNQ